MKLKRTKQGGMSLIELMIAITLSLFIVAALISLFVNSKQNYRLNENMSRLQENARFAVSFIARDLRMADYRNCVTDVRRADALTGETATGVNDSDSVTIIWQSNACGATSSTVTTVYTIKEGDSGNPALFRSVNGVDEELVEGIQSLSFSYGQDTDNDDVPNYFVDAASVTDMAQAVSVRVTLIARTLESNLTPEGGRISRPFSSTITLRNRLP